MIVELNTSGALEAVPTVFDDFVPTTLDNGTCESTKDESLARLRMLIRF